jgi:hypothetical protein
MIPQPAHPRFEFERCLVRLLTLTVLVGLVGGCGMREHREQMIALHRIGDYQQAAEILDDPAIKKGYGSRDLLLWELDRGAIALALDDHATTLDVLEQAEQQVDANLDESMSDTLARWTLSDADTTYMPSLHETIYINVLKLLAQLESGRLQGGATVEARRLSRKADRLRDLYVTYSQGLEKEAPGAAEEAARQGWIGTNEDNEFIESTLGTYLTAVTFMETGNTEFQRVAGRRLEDSIVLQKGLIGNVDPDGFKDLGSMRASDADVLVVAFSGRGPTKFPTRIGPVLIGTVPVYLELPTLEIAPSHASRIWVEIDAADRVELSLVEDLGRVAAASLEREMPSIYTRTFIRAAAKAALTAAAAEAARKQAADSDQVWAQVAVAVGGLLYMTATENADLRSWVFLPGEASVALLDLPPGPHRLRVVYEDRRGGIVYTTPWREINSPEQGLATIVEHYWD